MRLTCPSRGSALVPASSPGRRRRLEEDEGPLLVPHESNTVGPFDHFFLFHFYPATATLVQEQHAVTPLNHRTMTFSKRMNTDPLLQNLPAQSTRS